MKQENLHVLLSHKLSKDEILSFGKTVKLYNYDKILPLIASKQKELSANVAYIFLNASKATEIWLVGQTEFIMEVIQTTAHKKTKRLLLTILDKLKLDTININIRFFDYCLDNIISAKSPCAIRVLCMKLAYKQSAAYPELLSELKIMLETMDTHFHNPSVVCARRNILKKINSNL
jgi:hypothetical protein